MTSYTVHRYDLPLERPFRIAYDLIRASRNLLVTAEGDGLVGYGEAGPVPSITGEDQDRTVAALETWDADPLQRSPAELRARLGRAGAVAVEAAALDVAARVEGIPLYRLLRDAPPAELVTSVTIPVLPAAEASALATRYVTAGFRAFKVKAGAGLESDMDRIRAVRDAVGTLEVRVDANQGWSRREARVALDQLADLRVSVLEQPLQKADLQGHHDLLGAGLPIMLDESVFDRDDAVRALDAEACDRINIKLQKTGGLREAEAVAELAADAGVPCMVGCMIESRVGILTAAHFAASHRNVRWTDLDGATFLAEDPVEGGALIRDGVIRLDERPGLGIRHVQTGGAVARVRTGTTGAT